MGHVPFDDALVDLGLAHLVGALEVTGGSDLAALASPLAVAGCAISSVGTCLLAAADLAQSRTGRLPDVSLDAGHVAAAVQSEAWLLDPDGRGVPGFAPLSRLWPAQDGWVRTHANYTWHRRALLAALGVGDGPDADVAPLVADAIGGLPAEAVEERVHGAGGLAVAARRNAQWRDSAQGSAAVATRLVEVTSLGAAADLVAPTGALPAAGLRVLDLTRVIAGPVGTRMLAALGADVLRIDHPDRPELPLHAVDGVIGKSSALLDAGTPAGQAALHHLVDQVDLVVTGYRPGAMRHLGLDPDQIADRHPGVSLVTLSAWGTTGPWAGRRGFDSLVQIATGIGWASSPDGQRPGALPCQLLDHASGYLVAAGALRAAAIRARAGTASHVAVSLARTAGWLLDQGARATTPVGRLDVDPYRTPLGDGWTSISPPGHIDGEALAWPRLPPRYGGTRLPQPPATWL